MGAAKYTKKLEIKIDAHMIIGIIIFYFIYFYILLLCYLRFNSIITIIFTP